MRAGFLLRGERMRSEVARRGERMRSRVGRASERMRGRISTGRRDRPTALVVIPWVAAGAAGAAAGVYFLDPDNGRRRRAIARDRATGLARRLLRRGRGRAQVAAQMTRDRAAGAAHEARHAVEGERPAENDQQLADRVQTEIFRPDDIPKGAVSVNAEMGVVYLRGEVRSPGDIDELVSRAERVDGVRAVESFLHVPGEPAPMKHETEPETRRRVLAGRRR